MTKKIWFQIGTNDGDDLFRNRALTDKPDIVILVEPNISLLETINKNYESVKQTTEVYVYSNAVYYENDKTVELVIPSKNGVYGRKADNGHTYSNIHFSLLAMNDWGSKDDMVNIQAKTITFDQICENHNLTQIDYLQIDTEGFDYEIIKMIDLAKYRIKCIRFEIWGFDPERYETYHADKMNELGKNGLDTVIQKLKSHNYEIHEIKDSDGNDMIAVRKDM